MAEYIEREAAMLQIDAADFVRDDNFEGGATLLFCDDVVDRLSAIPAADVRPVEWIPVSERLPERGQDVLVMVHWRDYPEDMMCYGRKYKTRWYLWNGELGEIYKGFDITHWMPLPQPPKEET